MPGKAWLKSGRAACLLVLILFGLRVNAAIAAPAVPDPSVLARLVWTTMIAVDNANRTGRYEVLQAMGSPAFRANNSAQDLAAVFRDLRERRIDVGKALLIEPSYHIAPAITSAGQLRLRGGFEFRPRAIRFDILFDLVEGGWQIGALSIAEMDSSQR